MPLREKIVCAKVEVPQNCTTCGSSLQLGGPIWNSEIHNTDFARRLLESVNKEECKLGTKKRIQGVLGGIIDEEILASVPLSFDLSQVASNIRVENPKKPSVIAAFRSLEYKVCQTYYNPDLWKTNAPPEAVYDIFKQYKKEITKGDESLYLKNITEDSPARRILQSEIKHKPNFDIDQVKQQV